MDTTPSNALDQIKVLAEQLSTKELLQLQVFVANQINGKRKKEQEEAMIQIHAIAKSVGLSLKEILHPKPSKKKD